MPNSIAQGRHMAISLLPCQVLYRYSIQCSMLCVLPAGGIVDPSQSNDHEEKAQCEKMHEIIKEHKLNGEMRWLVAQKDPIVNGEIYR